jgi:hypothetical protein
LKQEYADNRSAGSQSDKAASQAARNSDRASSQLNRLGRISVLPDSRDLVELRLLAGSSLLTSKRMSKASSARRTRPSCAGDGLLPDNERVLDRWAKKFQVSARNVFALISHVGADCAGAVQFVTTDRQEVLIQPQPNERRLSYLQPGDISNGHNS